MDNKYWADYDDALCEQYDKELEDRMAEHDAIAAEQSIRESAPEHSALIQRKPTYQDISGDDSSLNPVNW